MTSKILPLVLSLWAAATGAYADNDPPVAIANSERFPLTSEINGVEYEIYVHTPPACTRAAPCPVIYTLDAEYQFGLSALIVTHLADRNRIPPLITVSIAYADKSRYRENRTRDYTPYFFPTGGYGEETQKLSGGGPEFRNVIRTEIIPVIDARFPVSTTERTLVGHSYGGLFAVYAWIEDPTLFSNYIIVSPSLWYADHQPLDDVTSACKRDGPQADLFLAVGSFEEQPENGRAMVSDLQALNAIFADCAAGEPQTALRVFDRETHASVFPAALSTGLRALFQLP